MKCTMSFLSPPKKVRRAFLGLTAAMAVSLVVYLFLLKNEVSLS